MPLAEGEVYNFTTPHSDYSGNHIIIYTKAIYQYQYIV